jgi:hypothetical protein
LPPARRIFALIDATAIYMYINGVKDVIRGMEAIYDKYNCKLKAKKDK